MAGWYRTGTVSVTSGSNAVAGAGTLWVTNGIAPGDVFTTDNLTLYEVQTVTADGAITLDRNFAGTTAAGASYAIIRNLSAASAALLNAVNSLNATYQAVLTAGITTGAQAQAQAGNYAVASGSTNAYAVTLTPAVASLAAIQGAPIRIKIPTANTGASTLNVAALGAVSILHPNGAALLAGELPAGGIAEVIYDGSNFQLISVSAYPGAGLRNRLINGAMMIAQRGTSFPTIVSGGTYTLDRWLVGWAGAAVTAQQSSAAPSGASYALLITGAAGNTGVTLSQRIESVNCPDFVTGASITISGWFYQNTGATILPYAQIYAPPSADSYTGFTSIGIAPSLGTLPSGVWTYVSATIALTGSGANGVQVSFGSNAAIGASQVFAATNLQVETGAIATPFERRPIGQEMVLCQRYFEALSALSGSFYATGAGQGFSVYMKFAASKRAQPTVSAPTTNSNCSTSVINRFPDLFAVQALSTAAGTLSFFTPSSITASAEL